MPPCAVQTCAVRPVFARVVGELRAADPSNVHGPVKQNASPGEQSEAPRPRWKPGQGQNPGPENQDNQHMLEQPRGYFPDFDGKQKGGFVKVGVGECALVPGFVQGNIRMHPRPEWLGGVHVNPAFSESGHLSLELWFA